VVIYLKLTTIVTVLSDISKNQLFNTRQMY